MLVLTAVAALNAFDGASLMAMDVQIENTVLEVTIASETGRMSVLQKATGILWEQELTLPNSQSVADFQVNRGQNVISYSLTVVEGQPQPLELTVELALIGDEPSIDVTLASKGGAYVEMHHFGYPAPLYPTTPENYFLALPEFGNGRYVSVSDPRYRLHCKVSEMPTRQPHESSFTRGWFETFWGLLMPWVAVTDGEQGMIVVAMTPWDAVIATQARANDEAGLSFPGSVWEPSKNIWGEDRKVRLAFFETGGHVAACKIYREIAKQQGYVRTLADKAMVRPDVEKLMGAVDWWGAAGKDQGIQWNAAITPLPFVKEAIAEGIDRGLVERLPQRGKWAPEEIAGVVQRGWLASTYDNYRDITDDPGWLSAFPGPINYCVALPIEDYAAVGGDGEIMPGWFSFRLNCTEKQLERAQVIIPEVLQTYPYNARFLDVTASEELVECYSPVHPTTRRSDQANREQLLNYVSEDVKIVTGAELGRFFSVPNVDYHMGTMMAEFLMGWGTSSLSDPRNRDELGEDYLAYGLNPAVRAPLFELVFHDCVVNYWWWGDSSEFLHGVAPELTDRKTAMNIIHGTPPQMWPYEHSLHWDIPQERELMLTIYRNVCKLHEIIGMQEMASHTFLTPDRMVQQTVFTDGTTCTVNFGAATYSVASGREQGRVFDLGENDFYVVGPEIEQWRACDGGSSHRTVIRTDTYYSVESGTTLYHDEMLSSAGTVTVKKDDAEQAHIRLAAGSSLTLDVLSWQPNWANLPRIVVRLDNLGQPIDRIKGSDSDIITLVTPVEKCSYLLLVGSKALAPDIETLNDSGLDSWPASGMVFEGAQAEGPYLDPGRDKIVLVNNSLFPINWTAGESESWHQLSPSSGTIAAYGTADVSVTVPAAVARAMSVGTYTSVITVNDTTNGVSHDSAMELRIGPSPSPALSINGSFEDGTLGWAGYSTDYYGLGDGTTTRTGWTFTGGEGRWLIGPPDSAGKTTDGDYCLSPSTTGGSFDLSQTFSVIDGMTYEVTFDAADWGNSYKGTEPGAYMTVACGGSSQTVYKTDYTADADFHSESFRFTASGDSATMQITAVSVYGFLLDNITVLEVLAGDFEPVGGDGDVDSADLLYFAQRWLNTGCDSPDWCDGADLDQQGGIVDLRDFAIFAENWLK